MVPTSKIATRTSGKNFATVYDTVKFSGNASKYSKQRRNIFRDT